MRLVRTLLSAEVDRRIARVIVIGALADLGILAVQGPQALPKRRDISLRIPSTRALIARRG